MTPIRLALLVTCATLAAVPCVSAQPADSRLVFIDLSGDLVRTVSFDWSEFDGGFDLDKACEADPQKIKDCMTCNFEKHSTRWISRQGSAIQAFVLFNEATTLPTISFKENKRESQLATDFATLMKVGKAIADRKEIDLVPLRCATQTYRLRHTRANLDVSAEIAAPTVVEAANAGTTPPKRSAKLTLTTGPKEHWFLSADVPVRRLKDVKLGDGGGIEPTETPTKFFVGLNYAIGDLFDDRPRGSLRALTDNLVGRVMFEASKTPLESLGIALALRGNYLSSMGLDFNVVSPFVGYVWTRPDPDEATPAIGEPPAKFARTLQFGFSFNLTKALGWLQSDK